MAILHLNLHREYFAQIAAGAGTPAAGDLWPRARTAG